MGAEHFTEGLVQQVCGGVVAFDGTATLRIECDDGAAAELPGEMAERGLASVRGLRRPLAATERGLSSMRMRLLRRYSDQGPEGCPAAGRRTRRACCAARRTP